ncbi:hypothetical protein RB195_014075 [Necator americanus]|uniref:Uncharacterized protein n=1 Tax=Necator americanus TaxID=51031 RepID=A0ABR1DYZ9_NECAM
MRQEPCRRSNSAVSGAHDRLAQVAKELQLRVWWNWKGIIHYELLPSNQTLNSDFCCQQLTREKQAIVQKWPDLAKRKGVVLDQDNTTSRDVPSKVRRAWMGGFTAPAAWSRHGTKPLSLFQAFAKFLKTGRKRDLWK